VIIFDNQVGFDLFTLTHFLEAAGFCGVQRVGNFNLNFDDTSDMVFHDYFISLNVVAEVCLEKKDSAARRRFEGDGFEIQHNAEPYGGYKV
jgi:hypothetical protein